MKPAREGTHNPMLRARKANTWIVCAALCVTVALLAACQPMAHPHVGSTTPTPLPAKFFVGLGKPLTVRAPSIYPPFVIVQFTSATTYEQAVAFVTSLGLQPLYPCEGQGLLAGSPWASLDERWIYDLNPDGHRLWVDGSAQPADQPAYKTLPADPLAAPGWLTQLAAAPDVTEIDIGGWNCPLLGGSTTARFIGPQRTTTYVRVTFTGVPYEQAVVEISGVGYRLADPCYETAHPHPAWHPMGQASAYATTQGLILAVTEANSTQWQTQTQHLQGFVSLTAPYSTAC